MISSAAIRPTASSSSASSRPPGARSPTKDRPSASAAARWCATVTVRTGSRRRSTAAAECSNEYFGNDPIFGVVKQCEVVGSAAPDTGWTRVASEDESFAVSGTQTVRYGSGSSWVTKSVSGGGRMQQRLLRQRSDLRRGQAVRGVASNGSATPVAGTCSAPVAAIDTSAVQATVGDGTPGSCTEAALREALASHDTITFNCGAAPVTIPVSAQIELPTDRNLVIDGGGKVTLDGGGRTRILSLMRLDYRTNVNGLTLQHIALANGKAAANWLRAAGPEPAAVRVGLCRRRRRCDRGARRAAARRRCRVPQQQRGVAAGCGRRRDLRDGLARRDRRRLALLRQLRLERRRDRAAAEQWPIRQQPVQRQFGDR